MSQKSSPGKRPPGKRFSIEERMEDNEIIARAARAAAKKPFLIRCDKCNELTDMKQLKKYDGKVINLPYPVFLCPKCTQEESHGS